MVTDVLGAMDRPVMRETAVMALLCLLDGAYTVLVVGMGIAMEANPIMAYLIDRGFVAFMVGKTLTFMPALVVLEAIRHRSPRFIPSALQTGIALYLLIYVVGSVLIHFPAV
jgi:hypothetical protein